MIAVFWHFLEPFYLSCSFQYNLPICFTSKNSFQLPLLTEELSIYKSLKLFAINWILPKSDNNVRKYLQQDCVIFTNLFLCYTFEWNPVILIALQIYVVWSFVYNQLWFHFVPFSLLCSYLPQLSPANLYLPTLAYLILLCHICSYWF